MESWGIAVAAGIGALAWIYQRAWERHERRLQRYEGIISQLQSLTSLQRDPDKIDALLIEQRKLWLIAPDEIVLAFERLFAAKSSGTEADRAEALARLVLAMRKDASFLSALIPRYFRSRLSPSDIQIRLATRTPKPS